MILGALFGRPPPMPPPQSRGGGMSTSWREQLKPTFGCGEVGVHSSSASIAFVSSPGGDDSTEKPVSRTSLSPWAIRRFLHHDVSGLRCLVLRGARHHIGDPCRRHRRCVRRIHSGAHQPLKNALDARVRALLRRHPRLVLQVLVQLGVMHQGVGRGLRRGCG